MMISQILNILREKNQIAGYTPGDGGCTIKKFK